MGIIDRIIDLHHRMNKWNPDKKSLWVRALRMTRLPGIKEALKDDVPYLLRIFWLLAFFACLSFGIQLSIETLNQFLERPILHTFHDAGVPLDRIPFPGVTIASPYLLRMSIMEKAMKMYYQSVDVGEVIENGIAWSKKDISKLLCMIDNFCEAGNSFGKRFEAINPTKSFELHKQLNWVRQQNVSLVDSTDETNTNKIIPMIQKGLINCSEIIFPCLWQGSDAKTCSELFGVAQTDVGTGCAFNKMPDEVLKKDKGIKSQLHGHGGKSNGEYKSWNKWEIDKHPFLEEDEILEAEENVLPRRQLVPGFDKGLSFLVKYEENPDIACPLMDTKDYVICIHHPFEEPKLKLNGCYNVPKSKQVLIKIRVELTLADPKIKKLTPKQRKCYFESENPLKVYKRYTEGNCHNECLAKRINATCECLPLSMTVGKNETICGPLERKCVQNVTDTMEKQTFRKLCPHCYRSCSEINYRAEVTYSDIVEFDIPQVFNFNENVTYSLVHVFFDEKTVISKERGILYDNNALLGVFGGILGLTIGVDIIQMFNILAGIVTFFPIRKCIKIGCKQCSKLGSSIINILKYCKPKTSPAVDPENPEESVTPSQTTPTTISIQTEVSVYSILFKRYFHKKNCNHCDDTFGCMRRFPLRSHDPAFLTSGQNHI